MDRGGRPEGPAADGCVRPPERSGRSRRIPDRYSRTHMVVCGGAGVFCVNMGGTAEVCFPGFCPCLQWGRKLFLYFVLQSKIYVRPSSAPHWRPMREAARGALAPGPSGRGALAPGAPEQPSAVRLDGPQRNLCILQGGIRHDKKAGVVQGPRPAMAGRRPLESRLTGWGLFERDTESYICPEEATDKADFQKKIPVF